MKTRRLKLETNIFVFQLFLLVLHTFFTKKPTVSQNSPTAKLVSNKFIFYFIFAKKIYIYFDTKFNKSLHHHSSSSSINKIHTKKFKIKS